LKPLLDFWLLMTNLATYCSKKVMWRKYSFEFRYLRLLILSWVGFAKQLKLKQVGGPPIGIPISNFTRIAVSTKIITSSGATFPLATRTINRGRNTLLLLGHGAKHLLRYEIFLVFGSQIVWIHVPKWKLDRRDSLRIHNFLVHIF